ncbi:O-antigen ligase family protein [Arenibaculum sp.]|jgi:O-antigen ligase|uniref:O-antigen ligase family protein n=1 Tax=Arenibaculum sp. TaxID=2865862 RepID=UPI002E0E3437|nr:O-antigen ligase family protein [Arenibaculum sp.]
MPAATVGRPAPETEAGARIWALILLLALLPLPFGGARPWAGAAFAVAVGLMLAVWSLRCAVAGRPGAIPLRRLAAEGLLLALLAGWIAFQGLSLTPAAWHHPIWDEAATALSTEPVGAISVDPARSFTALATLLGHASLFWLVLQAGREPGRAHRLLAALVAIGTAYAAYGLTMELSGAGLVLWFEKWAYHGDITATFVNRNSFATYAGLCLLAAIGLLARQLLRHDGKQAPRRERLLRRIQALAGRGSLLLGAVAILATALLLSHSRAGMVSTGIGIAVFLIVFLLNPGQRRGRRLPVAAAVFLALLAVTNFSGEGTLLRLRATEFETGNGRFPVYALMQRAIADSPHLGFGYGTFERTFPLYRTADVAIRFDRGHNDWLESAMDLGLPGAALLIGLFALPFLRCLRAGLTRRRDGLYPALACGATALVATHALLDFSLQIPAVAATFTALLALGVAQSWSSRLDG